MVFYKYSMLFLLCRNNKIPDVRLNCEQELMVVPDTYMTNCLCKAAKSIYQYLQPLLSKRDFAEYVSYKYS